jgi:hypothetical protein
MALETFGFLYRAIKTFVYSRNVMCNLVICKMKIAWASGRQARKKKKVI